MVLDEVKAPSFDSSCHIAIQDKIAGRAADQLTTNFFSFSDVFSFCFLYSLLYSLLPEAMAPAFSRLPDCHQHPGPVVYNPSLGQFFQAQTLSVTQYLQKKLMEETMDGPLTDYGSSDSDDQISPPITRNSQLNRSETLTTRNMPTVTSASPKTIRNKERDALRRNNKRQKQQMADDNGVKLHAKRRRIDALKEALQIKFDLQKDVIVTTTGWQGGHTGPLPKKNFTKEEVQRDYGLVHFPWDGRPRQKADQPGEWEATCQDAFEALKLAASSMAFSEKETNHRRGPFPSVPHGISFGGGQTEPKHLSHGSEAKTQILENVMMQKSIQRICNFASEGLRLYSERNYKHMKETMEALRQHYNDCIEPQRKLRRPYDQSVGVFPCRSFNLGEQSVSYPHKDDANLAQSWCSITPLGLFDATRGGQLILWDLGLVVDFPSGSTILIPSALILHSNAPISLHETRYAIVQYAAAGLFRWVENGFMSEATWLARATKKQIQERLDSQKNRWAEAAKMFTRLPELIPKDQN
ncbi:hypothetical protein H0H93_003147 [Arthromyces matolae]|nr:hypothetical protein H0H93_003147 [Arthromyces matolae]